MEISDTYQICISNVKKNMYLPTILDKIGQSIKDKKIKKLASTITCKNQYLEIYEFEKKLIAIKIKRDIAYLTITGDENESERTRKNIENKCGIILKEIN